MPDSFSTSFIPRKEGGKPSRKGPSFVDLYRAIGILIFVIALLLAVGVFLYQQLLESSIERKEEALVRAREAFEPELIEELSRLDRRLEAAELLLSEHLAPTQLFSLLESITLTTVRFTDMSYQESAGVHTLSLSGEGRSFASLALQSDEFGANRFIQEPVFSGLQVNEVGNVDFGIIATVEPGLFTYDPAASDMVVPEAPEDIESTNDIEPATTTQVETDTSTVTPTTTP